MKTQTLFNISREQKTDENGTKNAGIQKETQ